MRSCGTVPPRGAVELAQAKPDLCLVGMRSYGRTRTFVALTGYEQVRSVVAAIAGDRVAAERVELVLPETGPVPEVVSPARQRAAVGAADRFPWS